MIDIKLLRRCAIVKISQDIRQMDWFLQFATIHDKKALQNFFNQNCAVPPSNNASDLPNDEDHRHRGSGRARGYRGNRVRSNFPCHGLTVLESQHITFMSRSGGEKKRAIRGTRRRRA